MSLKLLCHLLLLIVSLPSNPSNGDRVYEYKPESYPYLALIEVQQSKGHSNFYNGAFASLNWVITASFALAQEPTGKPRNDSFLVYGGVHSTNEIDTGLKRKVNKIVTDIMGSDDNKYYPNLALLRLEKSFTKSKTLKPATFNIGMVSESGVVVGWIADVEDSSIIYDPLWMDAVSLPSINCSKVYSIVEFTSQMCIITLESTYGNFVFLEGALFVDQNRYVTALVQMNTRLQMFNMMPLMVLVRIGSFKEYLEYNVISPSPNVIFIHSNITDDIEHPPWYDIGGRNEDSGSRSFPFWTSIIIGTSLAAAVFIL